MRTLLFFAGLASVAVADDHDAMQVMRWRSCSVLPYKQHETSTICDRIYRNWSRYQAVASTSKVPAHVISGLHNMEAGGSFLCHLHEGSSLKWRTRYVPIGRPKTGNPPFTWEFSAQDALAYDHMAEKNWKRLGPTLTACELYNGGGFMRYHPETPTPYLWSGSSVARPGKYIRDGVWSPTAISAQIGIAPIWKELQRRRIINLPPE